jgi:hypothetical protein
MRYFILILLTLGLAGFASAAPAPQRSGPVTEGYLVAGIEGRAAKNSDKNVWEFFPVVDITDSKGLLPAQKAIPLLTCSTLEQIAQLAGDELTLQLRLWAMVTEFRGRNFLYGLYFLPVKTQAEPAPPPQPKPEDPKKEEKESVLPGEILQMMQRNPIPDLKRLDELVVVTSDRNLIHRTGQMQASEGGFTFTPDAFGQNVERDTYNLLNSKGLEAIQRAMQTTLGRQRYVVSGVTTQFEGKTYLLLRRAVRTYTHGNFTP